MRSLVEVGIRRIRLAEDLFKPTTTHKARSMDTERHRAEKQTYLRDEILEQGYDAGEFKDYLDSLKPEG